VTIYSVGVCFSLKTNLPLNSVQDGINEKIINRHRERTIHRRVFGVGGAAAEHEASARRDNYDDEQAIALSAGTSRALARSQTET